MELALATNRRRSTESRRRMKGDIMSKNMKRKPRRSSPRGGAVKHNERTLHEHSKDFDDIAAKIQSMSRSEVRDLLLGYDIDPDASVQRLKATMDKVLAAVRRGHHQGKTVIGGSAGRGVVFAAVGLRPQFLENDIRAAESPHAALTAISQGFEQLGVEADALRNHCAADPDAVSPLIECVYGAAIATAGRTELWKLFAGACATLASRMARVHRCVFVRGVQERLEDGDVPPGFIAILDEVASSALVAQHHAAAPEGKGPH
jgi:hypothetical protein